MAFWSRSKNKKNEPDGAAPAAPKRSSVPTGLPPLPHDDHIDAGVKIAKRLQDEGYEAYFVGGFVRDWLLGLHPVDVDIATSAHPEDVERIFEKTRTVGAHFGVVLVESGGETIEVATFRTDSAYTDFRRPDSVTYGTVEDDAQRRDFTVNALYYDPVSGKVKDLVEGSLDLRRRVLRTVGPAVKRFQEDALRLMRAVRFATRYGLEIDERTRKAFKIRVKNLDMISNERIGEELIKILTGPNRGRAVHLMSDLGIWPYVIPEMGAMRGVEQGEQYHPEGDVFVHTALAVDSLPDNPSPAVALGTLLHDIGKPATASGDGGIHFYDHAGVGAKMTREICTRLKYSNELTDQVVELVANHMQFMVVREMRPAKLKRFLGRPDFDLLLAVHRADSAASDGDLEAYDFCVEQHALLEAEHGASRRPDPLATGDDLIEMGLNPGPTFRDLLEALHDEQLEGRVATRDEAIAFLREKIAEQE